MHESDEICECGHAKSHHNVDDGIGGPCDLGCGCTRFTPRKERQEKCARCGHTEEEHLRFAYPAHAALPRTCRVMGCNCAGFTTESAVGRPHTLVEKQILREAKARMEPSREPPRPRVAFARFTAVLDPQDGIGTHLDVRINPEDVSSVSSTGYSGIVRVTMRQKEIWLVRGTVDEVEAKLQGAR